MGGNGLHLRTAVLIPTAHQLQTASGCYVSRFQASGYPFLMLKQTRKQAGWVGCLFQVTVLLAAFLCPISWNLLGQHCLGSLDT